MSEPFFRRVEHPDGSVAFEEVSPVESGGLPAATHPRQAPMWTGTQWVADGVPRIVRCPFAFDTPGLLTGVPIFTPHEGDVLLDAWISTETAWDTIAHADIGPASWFAYAFSGWFNGAEPDMGIADSQDALAGLFASPPNSSPNSRLSGLFTAVGYRALPARFANNDPICVVVSTTGQTSGNSGVDPGAAQGSGTVYLMVATPATG